MEHFNIFLFCLGGFFVVISSIKPSNSSNRDNSIELNEEM